jgi:hypothetical protein
MQVQEIIENTPNLPIASAEQHQELAKLIGDSRIIWNTKVQAPDKHPHLRATGKGAKATTAPEIETLLKQKLRSNEIKLEKTNPAQDPKSRLTKSYDSYTFVYKDLRYFIATIQDVTAPKGERVPVFIKQELTPVGLGLPKETTVGNLVNQVKTGIQQRIKNPYQQQILLHVLQNAVALQKGQQQTPVPEELAFMVAGKTNKNRNQISQNFGEVLAPIIFAKGASDQVEFPRGNEPIVDVKLKGVDIAVKSLSGSGNSLVKMKDIFDTFQETIDKKDTKKKAITGFYQKLADDSLSVIELIVQSIADVKTPEYVKLLADTKMNQIYSEPELEAAIKKLITRNGKAIPYQEMITKATKILGANGHKAFGIPIDVKTTGAAKYKNKPVRYTYLMFAYGLGKGLEYQVRNGADKDAYSKTLTDIMKTIKAECGFVDVDQNGLIEVSKAPFSQLNFLFDYHAYTSNPGNNRPGFVIVK